MWLCSELFGQGRLKQAHSLQPWGCHWLPRRPVFAPFPPPPACCVDQTPLQSTVFLGGGFLTLMGTLPRRLEAEVLPCRPPPQCFDVRSILPTETVMIYFLPSPLTLFFLPAGLLCGPGPAAERGSRLEVGQHRVLRHCIPDPPAVQAAVRCVAPSTCFAAAEKGALFRGAYSAGGRAQIRQPAWQPSKHMPACRVVAPVLFSQYQRARSRPSPLHPCLPLAPSDCTPALSSPYPADFAGFAKDNGEFCTSIPLAPEVSRVLEQETLRAGKEDSCLPLQLCFPRLQGGPRLPA